MKIHWVSRPAPANAGYAISMGRQSDGSSTCRICSFNGSVGRLLQMQDMKVHWFSRTAPAHAGFAISMGQSDGPCTCRICNFTTFHSISFILSMWYDDYADDNDAVKTCTKTATVGHGKSLFD